MTGPRSGVYSRLHLARNSTSCCFGRWTASAAKVFWTRYNTFIRLSSYGVEWFSYREEYLRSVGVFKEAVLAILAAIAKQERIRLSERVQAGLSRARAQGKALGRPRAAVRSERVLRLRERGLSLREIAAETGVSAMTVQRIIAAQG